MPAFLCGRYNYRSQLEPFLAEVMADLKSMLLDGRYILTPEVRRFEAAFAEYIGVRFCVGVNCGTDALLLTLKALNIQPGDEVITQANTFNATVTAIQLAGATPVLVDADDCTYLMDQEQMRAAVTPRTRAIMPVHLFGKPTPMNGILDAAQERGIFVVEDAAQAHGAIRNGQRAGSYGIAGCFSFHPSKNLAAAGDAGAIVTDDAFLANALLQLRTLGQREQNDHVAVGYNSKLDALQARILTCKLPYLDQWNAQRRRIAQLYRESLHNLPIRFQREDPNEDPVYHLFQIRVTERDRLLAHLIEDRIDAVVRYPVPIHCQQAFTHWGWQQGQFPVAERLARELLCLPIRPDMTEADVGFVSNSIARFYGAARAVGH